MSAELFPSQIDYKLQKVTAPYYSYRQVPLNNLPSGTTGTIGPTGTTVLEWRLPTDVYNLARSYISYDMNIPLQGANNASVTFEDLFELGSSVTFGGAAGMDLVNVPFAQNYSKVARKLDTSFDTMMTNDNLCGLYNANLPATSTPAITGMGTYNLSVGGVTTSVPAINAVSAKVGNLVPGGNLSAGSSIVGGVVVPSYASCMDYVESQYCDIGVANTTEDTYRRYPLGAFTGTLLGVDKDFYSPVEQYLRITCGTGDKMGYITSYDPTQVLGAANNPSTGAASLIAPLTVNNIMLYLCVERNDYIIRNLKDMCFSGQMKYSIPYLSASRYAAGAAGSQQNINVQIPMQYGKRLKRIIHTVWNPQERLNTAYDQDNYNGAKTINYQTSLNSRNLQDRVLSCAASAGNILGGDDWLENKKFFGPSSCISSQDMYSLNWMHIDQFYEPHQDGIDLPEENLEEGLVMDSSKQWVFNCLPGVSGLIHYTWLQFQREIIIDASGPQWLAAALNLSV